MKIGILTFEQFHGRKDIGSSRIRGHWLAKYWDEAEIFKHGRKYDVVIYQKAYWVEHAKEFDGVKILDVCDPDFLHWGYRITEMIQKVDAITTSTEALTEAFRNFTNKPVVCIPDRVDLEVHKEKKYHIGKAKNVVWFGYSTGFELLKPVAYFLKKLGLGLIVISDTSFNPGSSYSDVSVKNYPWNIEIVNKDILSGDIVLNPQSTKGKWKYKSNNKTLTAWALGMPVAHNLEELERFIDPTERKKEQVLRAKEIKDKWDIVLSVKQYQEIIDKLQQIKNGEAVDNSN